MPTTATAPAHHFQSFISHLPIKLYPPESAHCLKPLPDGTPAAPLSKRNNLSLSLLDEVGRLAQSVSPTQVAAWKRQLHQPHLPANTAARLRIRLGEYQLAHDQNPEQAHASFRLAQSLCKRSSPLYGLAAYDIATSLFYEGAFQEAAKAFHHLLAAKPSYSGFDHHTCALWAKHAFACAGYHQMHARLGIPEPARLDPMCGAASLSSYLKANGLPYDKKTILSVCRVTGEGSRLQDILNAARKLGLSARAVTADDQGLIALPKPLTAFIDRDNFINVVSSSNKCV